MSDAYKEDDVSLNGEEIKQKADHLAKKFYEENKTIIEEITDDSKEVLAENQSSDNNVTLPKKSFKKKLFYTFIGFSALTLILILIISNVMSVGNKIIDSNKYLGIAFYVLVALLVVFLIIVPGIQMMFLPSYNSLFALEEKGQKEKIKANVKKIMYIVKRHQVNWKIDQLGKVKHEKYQEAVKTLKSSHDDEELKKAYRYIYKTYIKKDVMDIITSYSNKIFLATAVVQSGKIDSFVMLSTYFKMSKDILRYCGYRIKWIRLCKLMVEVLKMLIAATKLSQIDFSAIFPKMMMNSLSKIPGARVVVNSLSDGVTNALLFYKTGVMLEEFLLSDNQSLIHQWGVSIKETARYMLVGLVGEILRKVAEFTTIALKKTIEGIQNFFITIQNQISAKKGNKKPLLTHN